MTIMQKIRRLADSHYNAYLEERKISGQKIIGYFCSYVPEEIIHAAGLIPYRMRAVGNDYAKKGDVYYSSLNCSFVKCCFDMVLREEYEFLDGVIFMNACDNMRRMYDNWKDAKGTLDIKPDFLHMFCTPHIISPDSLNMYIDEIGKLIAAIEKRFGVSITEQDLKNSIRLYNVKRKLLAKIYDARKGAFPAIRGSEILSIMLAVTALPVEAAIDLLHEIVAPMDTRTISNDTDIRVYVAGGCLEEIEYVEMIEENGAIIVGDSLCLGTRHFDMEVDESEKPAMAIARRYLNKLSCPRIINRFDARSESIFSAVRVYNADAVIAMRLKFCVPWGIENVLLKKEAKRIGYPILILEREYHGGGMGQQKTRVQAFIDKVRNIKSGRSTIIGSNKQP
jgi:benzoyl-CoA reductase subunit C